MAPITYTPDEAFARFLERGTTKFQYIAKRDDRQYYKDEIFPPYRDIAKSMKKCIVKNSLVTDQIAKVPLQNLLDKTTSRLIQSQRDNFEAILQQFDSSPIDAEFVYIYGFNENSKNNDGIEELYSESESLTIFATTIIPLRLVTSDGTILWTNKTPHSVRFCRPVKFQIAEVTNEFVLKEKQLLDKEIENLKMFTFDLGDRKILRMSYKLNLTVIDGRILNILADIDKSNHECPICNASPQDSVENHKDMKATKFAPLNYGISPLHCSIRFVECILEMGYRRNIKKFEIIGDNDKKLFIENKQKIRDLINEQKYFANLFKSEDTGPTVFTFFKATCVLYHSKLLSEITGIDLNLVTNFKIIFHILLYGLPIDLNEFELFCSKTAQIFSEKYPWFPMPPIIHKVLVHGKQILENSILPVGNFNEREPEDYYEYDYDCGCDCHCNETKTRKEVLGEIFQRTLLLTDPLISTISLELKMKELKISDIPSVALPMLDIPNKKETNDDDEKNSDNYFFDGGSMNSLQLESMDEFYRS